jgi:plastocyanin
VTRRFISNLSIRENQMRQLTALTSALTAAALIAAGGCGGGGGDTPPGPTSSVLTSVVVTPATATLFTVEPGNTATLSGVAKDQDGQTMSGLGSPSFSSDNGAIATVSDNGTITAVGAGTVHITASLTAGGVTKTGTSTVTARVAPAIATVFAPQFAFQPAAVDLSAGGTMTWTFGPIQHNVTFTTAGAPGNVADLGNGSASRTFPTHGTFSFECTIHQGMTGIVHVH